jgi:hypothetical protein
MFTNLELSSKTSGVTNSQGTTEPVSAGYRLNPRIGWPARARFAKMGAPQHWTASHCSTKAAQNLSDLQQQLKADVDARLVIPKQ